MGGNGRARNFALPSFGLNNHLGRACSYFAALSMTRGRNHSRSGVLAATAAAEAKNATSSGPNGKGGVSNPIQLEGVLKSPPGDNGFHKNTAMALHPDLYAATLRQNCASATQSRAGQDAADRLGIILTARDAVKLPPFVGGFLRCEQLTTLTGPSGAPET